MKVLYVDHTSLVSGAQRALLDLLAALPERVSPVVMCPEGQLAGMVRGLNAEVVPFAGTAGSLRLHPAHTTRAVSEMARSARALRRAQHDLGVDVVHANSLRAGLIATAAKRRNGPAVVLHVHDALPDGASASFVKAVLRHGSDAVITISDYTTRNFGAVKGRGGVHMLSNPLDLDRFDPAAVPRNAAREALGLDATVPVLGVVAQITPWKGQEAAVRALELLREQHPDAVLLLVGQAKFVDRATRYDNIEYEKGLRRLIAERGLDEHVRFLGEREDVVELMRAMDVLVAPSWEEPFGRSIIEAMALETPVVSTNVGGPPEYIVDGVDGLLVDPRDPRAIARAVDRMLSDPEAARAMALRGSESARRRFDRRAYAERMVSIYETVVAGR